MSGIFNDDRRVSGVLWPNPAGTQPLWPLVGVAKGLKWPTLRRLSHLAGDQRGRADTMTMILNRP